MKHYDPNVERILIMKVISDVTFIKSMRSDAVGLQSIRTSLDVIVLKKVEAKKYLWTVAVVGTRWRRSVSP